MPNVKSKDLTPILPILPMIKKNHIMKCCLTQIICVILLIAVSGCSKPTVIDLTLTKPYAQLVGAEYRLITEVDAYGIYENLDRKKISFIEFIPGVGIAGPEVAFKKRIAKGQIITILSAWQERKLFHSDVYYVIALREGSLPRDIQLRIGLSRGNEGEGAELNPRVYERITR